MVLFFFLQPRVFSPFSPWQKLGPHLRTLTRLQPFWVNFPLPMCLRLLRKDATVTTLLLPCPGLPAPPGCPVPLPPLLVLLLTAYSCSLLRTALGSVSQSVVPGPAASTSPGNWFKIQIFKAYPTYGVRNLGLGLAFCFTIITAKFDNYCLRVSGNPTQKCP